MSPPADLDTARTIRRILRVNDAGERGGVALYRAQLAVARWRCPEVVPFLESTRDHEADHARRFRALMSSRGAKVCRLPWIWTAGALLMGLSTALFGARAVYLCTEVVERGVHRHLTIQLAFVRRHDAELAALITSVSADEMEHLEHATRMRGDRPAPFGRLFDTAITMSTEALMWLSTRGDIARLARQLEIEGARAGFWTDYAWNLHGRLVLASPPRVEIPARIAGDRFYRFLERTWMLQQLPVAVALFALDGWSWLLWGVCARVCVSVTGHWYVGRLAHRTGPQRWIVEASGVQAHDVPWAAIPTMGEAWHNNHHAWPGSAKLGLYPRQADLGFAFIRLLERLGLAWDVRTPETLPERAGLTQAQSKPRD